MTDRWRTWRTAWIATAAVAFVALTVAVSLRATTGIDDALRPPGIAPESGLGQVLAALSIAWWPGVLYAAALAIAWWAGQRRLRHLSWTLTGGAVGGWLASTLVSWLVARPRPAGTPDLITTQGYAYPSSHATAATVLAILVVASAWVTRQRPAVLRTVAVASGLGVVAVCLARWLIGAHHATDLLAGVLLGVVVAGIAVVAAGLHTADPPSEPVPAGDARTAALIVNPAKVADLASLRRHVEFELKSRGWNPPVWLETTPEDAGAGLATRALEDGVDLVLVAGGDGTTRVVCGAMAGSGVPVGIVPAGTTNLLARNLDVPLDETAALATALDGTPADIDIIRFVLDGDDENPEFSAVMGGVGVDGETFAHTDDKLKAAIGPVAYVVAAAQRLGANPALANVTITLDGGEPETHEVALVSIGNVGAITGGIEVIPGARPDDGELNVVLVTASNIGSWARIVGGTLAGSKQRPDIEQDMARLVEVNFDDPQELQLDGDALGTVSHLSAEVLAGGLRVMLPHA